MKYYKLSIIRRFPQEDKVLGHANGVFVTNGKAYFQRIGNGEVIPDAPVFDYFHLQSYGIPEEWEWRLQDVHSFIGDGSIINGWYISDKCKKLFEQFNIAKGFHFYATKLLYKGEKLNYWIFQIAAEENGISNKSYVDYQKSIFFDEEKGVLVEVKDYSEFKIARDKIEQKSDYEKDLITKRIVLKEHVDHIPMFCINNSGEIVSERLKTAIENEGLVGFIFSDLEYPVEIQPASPDI